MRSQQQSEPTIMRGVARRGRGERPILERLYGTLDKSDSSIVGFSFDYNFSQVGDGAQLRIFLNGKLYFAMTGAVASSSALPGSGKLSATFGLGDEWSGTFGEQAIQIVLTNPAGTSGTATTVTVNNFHTFTF
jgi:hypothetical protein